jgi:acyl-CoA thioesterase FadM
MTTTASPSIGSVRPPGSTSFSLRPSFEGCNIGTWIGFKHVLYLVEAGLLQFFREWGHEPGRLFEAYALCLEMNRSRTRLLSAISIDEEVLVECAPRQPTGSCLPFSVSVRRARAVGSGRLVHSEVDVAIRLVHQDRDPPLPPPPELAPYVAASARPVSAAITSHEHSALVGASPPSGAAQQLREKQPRAMIWKRRIPYFYCHYTDKLQHSGYVRLMEEAVELLLAERGISIARMLRERDWIPVVSDVSIELLEEAYMEELLYTVLQVEEIYKQVTHRARFDCYVEREGRLLKTAAGSVTHAYLRIGDRGTGGAVVPLDDDVVAALRGSGDR